jgi:hypothetical protein
LPACTAEGAAQHMLSDSSGRKKPHIGSTDL